MNFVHEDGKGKLFDDEGNEVSVVEMEVDQVNYPLGNVTDFNMYLDLKPPEKQQTAVEEVKKEVPEEASSGMQTESKGHKVYRKYKDEDKFFFLFDSRKSF